MISVVSLVFLSFFTDTHDIFFPFICGLKRLTHAIFRFTQFDNGSIHIRYFYTKPLQIILLFASFMI